MCQLWNRSLINSSNKDDFILKSKPVWTQLIIQLCTGCDFPPGSGVMHVHWDWMTCDIECYLFNSLNTCHLQVYWDWMTW